eukprot:357293-Chlamydomonas_euryale.AAC.11
MRGPGAVHSPRRRPPPRLTRPPALPQTVWQQRNQSVTGLEADNESAGEADATTNGDGISDNAYDVDDDGGDAGADRDAGRDGNDAYAIADANAES